MENLCLKPDFEIVNGRLITAARGLAGLTIAQLAAQAGVSERTIRRIEADEHVQIAPQQRHGCTARETWSKIIGALSKAGVELQVADSNRGAGVYWLKDVRHP